MPEPVRFSVPNEEFMEALRQLVLKYQAGELGAPPSTPRDGDGDAHFPPGVYVALAPVGGIPARSADTPGQADCDIYHVNQDDILDGTAVGSQTVYNLDASVIPSGAYVKISRDNFGKWIVGGAGAAGGPTLLLAVVKDVCFSSQTVKKQLIEVERNSVIGDEFCAPEPPDCCGTFERPGTGTGTAAIINGCCAGDTVPGTLYLHLTAPLNCCIPLDWDGATGWYSQGSVYSCSNESGAHTNDTSPNWYVNPFDGGCYRFHFGLFCYGNVWVVFWCFNSVEHATVCPFTSGNVENYGLCGPVVNGSSGFCGSYSPYDPGTFHFLGACSPFSVPVAGTAAGYFAFSGVLRSFDVTGTINTTACLAGELPTQASVCGTTPGTGTGTGGGGGAVTVGCCANTIPSTLWATFTGCSCITGAVQLHYQVGGPDIPYGFGGDISGWISDLVPCGGHHVMVYLYCASSPTQWNVRVWCDMSIEASQNGVSHVCDPFHAGTGFLSGSGLCCSGTFSVDVTETAP